jgi:diguanylate cyclase (GGDEF)-like protein
MQPLFFSLAVDVNVLTAQAVQVVFVIGLAFALISIGYSVYRFQKLFQAVEESALTAPEEEIESAFLVLLARRIGQVQRAAVSRFGVGLLQVRGPDGAPPESPAGGALVQRLQQQVRKAQDAVCHYKPGLFGVVIGGGSEVEPSVLNRLADQLRAGRAEENTGGACRGSMVWFPDQGQRSTVLVEQAEALLENAVWDGPVAHPASEGDQAPPADAPASEEDEEETIREIRKGLLDELTGVLSPAKVAGYFRKFILQQSKKTPMALLYVAVADLEEVEALHGRAEADEIRRGVSQILQTELRAEDVIGRFNENDFLVLMLCEAQHTLKIAERLREKTVRSRFGSTGRGLTARVNIGIGASEKHGRGLPPMFKAAEAACRKAAARGASMSEFYRD